MQRQDTQSTFSRLFNLLTCSVPPEKFSDEQELLLNPSEPDLFAVEVSSDENIEESIGEMSREEGPRISTDIDDGFYAECFEELTKCDNVVCCTGVCGMGVCACAGLMVGCTPVLLIPGPAVAAFTPVMQSLVLIVAPFGSMFAGFGAGALCWGKSTEASQRWVAGRTQENKSASVCGFFGSFCESNERLNRVPQLLGMHREVIEADKLVESPGMKRQ